MPRNRWINILAHAILFVAAVSLYSWTLNTDVQPADSGEFQIAAITLGIPHPPGYPLYTMLGWLFAQVPIGSPFGRVSFLSVIASAATLVLVSLVVQAIGRGEEERRRGGEEVARRGVRDQTTPVAFLTMAGGLLAAVALGTSTTFWSQATTTNIRSLTAFFTALMLFAVARLDGEARRADDAQQSSAKYHSSVVFLYLFTLAVGFGVGHHVSLVFIGFVLGLYALWIAIRLRLRWPSFVVAGLLFMLTQLVWLYLPLRDAAGARFAPGNLTTPDGLLNHIFARGFAGDMLAFAAPEFLFDRLTVLPTLFQFELSLPMLLITILAMLALVWKRRVPGLVLVLASGLHVFITITYRAPQTVEYAMPAWVILCVMLGSGLPFVITGIVELAKRFLPARRSSRTAALGLGALVVLLSWVFVIRDALERLPSFQILAQDWSTRAAAEGVLNNAIVKSTVLSQWHQATPMWALQDVEGLRRDVHVTYVYPRGAQPYADTFAEEAAAAAQQSATYVTSLYAVPFAARGLSAVPVNGIAAWQVLTTPLSMQDEPVLGSLVFDGRIEVLPLQLATRTAEAGQGLDVILQWRALGRIQGNESLSVRIMRSNGKLATNADLRLDPAVRINEVRSQRLTLGIPLDLGTGAHQILVGAYRSDTTGFVALKERSGDDFALAALVRVSPVGQPPVTQRSFGGYLTDPADPNLIGLDYDTGIPGQLRVITHWQLGLYGSTVSLFGREGQVLGLPQHIAAGMDLTHPQYQSVIFDIPVMRGLRMGLGGAEGIGRPDISLPDYVEGERYIPFANQMVLVGSNTHREGNQLKADLHWLSARPIVSDYIVSARVSGDGFYATHDGVPALGALPTLKWIRGSHITDRHPIALGDYRGPLRGTVLVYNGFTQEPLPPLDERYEDGVTFSVQ